MGTYPGSYGGYNSMGSSYGGGGGYNPMMMNQN